MIYTKFSDFLQESYIDINGNLMETELKQSDINEILKGYIECALWTEEERLSDENSTDIDDDDMDEIEKIIAFAEDIDDDSKIDAYNDIKKFIKTAGDEAIKEAIDENGLFKLGMDIWFTRNGHGAGFFDHGYEYEDVLTYSAKNLKEKSLYVGDDGKLYFE